VTLLSAHLRDLKRTLTELCGIIGGKATCASIRRCSVGLKIVDQSDQKQKKERKRIDTQTNRQIKSETLQFDLVEVVHG
jgi:hypothetical protein